MKQLLCVVLLSAVVTVNCLNSRDSKQVIPHSIRATERLRPGFAAALRGRPRFINEPAKKDCSPLWKTIPGGGNCCYLFSNDVSERRDWPLARPYCKQHGGDLASAGCLSAYDGDPLLKYVKEINLGRSWLGAHKLGSIWERSDERRLSLFSNMWGPGNPNGNGDCVEFINSNIRAYLNDPPCSFKEPFVCERSLDK